MSKTLVLSAVLLVAALVYSYSLRAYSQSPVEIARMVGEPPAARAYRVPTYYTVPAYRIPADRVGQGELDLPILQELLITPATERSARLCVTPIGACVMGQKVPAGSDCVCLSTLGVYEGIAQ